MQIPADPLDATALATALLPGKRGYHRHRLRVDWDRDGLYAHALSDVTRAVSDQPGIQLRRELTDSSPGSRAVASGASAAQLTATLNGSLMVAGRPVPISELLSPYNSSSPLYGVRIGGTPIRWEVATRTTRGWLWLDQFTGKLDERRTGLGGNTVRLVAMDAIGQMDAPAFWPPWAVDGVAAARTPALDPVESQRGLASSVVDQVLNAAGHRTRPRPPWEHDAAALALVWLPLCGSFAPAAGKMQAKYPWGSSAGLFPEKWTQAPAVRPDGAYWVGGPFGLARQAEAGTYPGSLMYMGRDTLPIWGERSTGMSIWVFCGPTAPGYDPSPASNLRPPLWQTYFGWFIFSGNYWAGRLGIASNGQVLQIQVEAGTDRIYRVNYTPGTDAWRHVHVELDHTAGAVRAKMFVDGVERANFVPTGTGDSQVGTPLNALFMPELGCRLQPCARVCDAMAWQQSGAPTILPERTVTVGAVVDPSLNQISYVPPPRGSHGQVLREVTAAEGGAVWADEQGVIRWHNRQTVRGDGAIVYTVTLSSAADVATVDSTVMLANTVECSARAGGATWTTAWELPAVDLISAPPGGSVWEFPTDDDVIAVEHGASPRLYQSATSASSVPVWGSSVVGGYIFIYDGGEDEELLNQAMIDPLYQYGWMDRQMIRLAITNTGAVAGRFRFKSDATTGTDARPALRIAGFVLAREQPEHATETYAESVTAAGRVIALSMGGSDWHQHLSSVQEAARWILRRATQPIPTFDRIEAPGDPRLQLADSGILELGPAGARVRTYLAGITRTFTSAGLMDDLAVRATHAPDRWALDDPVLGVLGTTAKVG